MKVQAKSSRMVRSIGMVAVVALLSACSSFPDLRARVSPEALNADFPKLLPAEDLRAQVATGPIEPREPIVAQQIDSRANALRARAASLKGDVIDAESRDRLDQTIEIEDEEV